MSSSSSDEDHDRLCEAVDPQFVVKKEKTGIKPPEKSTTDHSEQSHTTSNGTRQRSTLKDEEDWNYLGTTPGFRDHVARHLSKLLDKQIKEIDSSDRLAQPQKQDGGILLFTSSTAQCLIPNENKAKCMMKKLKSKRKLSSESSSSEDERQLKMVAVSADWVLNKRGVYTDQNPQPADVVMEDAEHNVHEKLK